MPIRAPRLRRYGAVSRPSGNVRVGCCGFALAHASYFSTFRLIEVQQTFYQPPRPATLERWRAAAPEDFEFTLKAWQLITHEPASPTYRRLTTPIPDSRQGRYGGFRGTDEVFAAWRTTLEAARALDAAAIVFQCPASFTPTTAHVRNLRAFFRAIAGESAAFRLCWEPRGDWDRKSVLDLCAELGLVLAVDPFANEPPPVGWRYFRLHGIGGYRYTYSDDDLHRLRGWCVDETYCLFNNMTMASDARRFDKLLARPGKP
jgi:uncharacterized protein YecE (DUF72 family)